MAEDQAAIYAPLGVLKPVCEDVWIVDGPAIGFGPPLLKMDFPTRMTVIRLRGGRQNEDALFLHSPVQPTPDLLAAIAALGPVRWIVGPNRIHYWWVDEWQAAFPDARSYLAPRIREQAARHRRALPPAAISLDHAEGWPWDAAIATLPVTGRYMTEVVFFHRPSHTLVLTDLIENFEPRKLPAWPLRLLARLGGVLAPDGSMPRDMRLTYPRRTLHMAVKTMLAWQPERVLLAHGRWHGHDGTAELRRAFDWLLD